MFDTLKSQKGFTLVEILVVVIIVAILAAIATPVYMSYVDRARSTEAQSALTAIRHAYTIHMQEYGNADNYTIEDAVKNAKLGKATEKNWKFEVSGTPPRMYIATSTSDNPAGEGRQVIYDVDAAQYKGYGLTEDPDEIDY